MLAECIPQIPPSPVHIWLSSNRLRLNPDNQQSGPFVRYVIFEYNSVLKRPPNMR